MTHLDKIATREVLPGFLGKFIHGKECTLGIWNIKKGSSLPEHKHVHEQLTYVEDGELEMIIGGEKMLFTAGMVHVIPSNTPHSAIAKSDCRVIDVFVPVREDYR